MVNYVKAEDYEAEDYLKMLCHGNSGAGKTHLGATGLKPVIALCERQALRTIRRANPEATVVIINSMEDLRALLADLMKMHASGDCPYDTVVLDSLTEMQRIIKQEIIDKAGVREQPTQGEWGIIIDRTINIARSFRDLPMNVLVITLSNEEFSGDGRFIRPSLSGKKLPNDLAGFFNVVGYAYKRLDDKNNVEHKVLFEGDDEFLTKGDPDLEYREDPHWPTWIAKCYGPSAIGAGSIPEKEKEDEAPEETPKETPPKKAKRGARNRRSKTAAANK